MTRIFDNIDLPLGPHLQETLDEFDSMDTAVGYFNLRGWKVFGNHVGKKSVNDGGRAIARVLIGMVVAGSQAETLEHLQRQLEGTFGAEPPVDNELSVHRQSQLISQLREQLSRGIPNEADRQTLRQLRDQIASGHVEIKIYTRRPLHGKTYIFHQESLNHPIMGFVGSSNLTSAGLHTNYELNVDVVDDQGAQKLADWFTAVWDDRRSLTISDAILQLIDDSWASEIPAKPYDVYLKLCHDLSKDVRDGLDEYTLAGPISEILLDYQREAVQTLARRIEQRGGTMLGDVVGLGKTLTAIAVASLLHDESGYSTLVVCPKNLQTMWEDHMHQFQIHGTVIPYSMAARHLPETRKYKFVIVDESHTMRTDTRQDYIALHKYIREYESKVLLLTATPYNLGFTDVLNQLKLWIDEDQDLGLQPTVALANDPNLPKKCNDKLSTLQAFKHSTEPDDWKRLMSEHLVRRTRSFIRQRAIDAGHEDARGVYLTFTNGTKFYFPTRIPKPLQHSFDVNDPASIMASDHTVDELRKLLLPRYDLSSYLAKDVAYTPAEADMVEGWRRSRGQVAGFVRTNFYKRLSSCGHSLVLSLNRHITRNDLFLYALNTNQLVPTGTLVDTMFTPNTDDDFDAELGLTVTTSDQYETLLESNPTAVTLVRPEIFSGAMCKALEHDNEILRTLMASFGEWSPLTDSKLLTLFKMLSEKHPNDKVLIFTEYADTAEYLGLELEQLGIANIAVATGNSENPTALARRFSPQSHRSIIDDAIEFEVIDPLRVLVATDVLSEGQNLQDAHIVVNYDLPWAIVKLIQRAGRVDRVGQESDKVLIYSMFHKSLDSVLDLRARIGRRLHDAASAFGSDEKFFGTPSEVKLLGDYYHGGNLEEPEDALGVDAASLAFGIWSKALLEDPSIAQRIPSLPDLVHSTKSGPGPTGFAGGVGCFVRTDRGFDAYGYAQGDGQVRLVTGQEILRIFACEPSTPGLDNREDNDLLLASLVIGDLAPLAKPQLQAGQLKGIRKTVWNKLNDSLHLNADGVEALDALYRHPLTHRAERVLRKSSHSGNLQELADMLVALNRDEELVTKAFGLDPIRIVSSMGITS